MHMTLSITVMIVEDSVTVFESSLGANLTITGTGSPTTLTLNFALLDGNATGNNY